MFLVVVRLIFQCGLKQVYITKPVETLFRECYSTCQRSCKVELKRSFKFIAPQNNGLLTIHPYSNEKKNMDKYVKLGFEIMRKSAVFSA